MTDDDDDHDQQLKSLHGQIDRLLDRLLKCKQDIARARRAVALMRRLPTHLCETLEPQLLEKMLKAEADRAADQATRQFPEFVDRIMDRVEQRKR